MGNVGIEISEMVYDRLIRLQGLIQYKCGKKLSLDDIIFRLVNEELDSFRFNVWG